MNVGAPAVRLESLEQSTSLGLAGERATAHQDATVIFRETGDRHREGLAMINLGIALQQVRRFDEAITACEEAAAIFCETEDQHNEQIALTNNLVHNNDWRS